MSGQKTSPMPVWMAPFAPVATAVESTIGTGTYTLSPTTVRSQATNGWLVQCTGANVYFRLDGNPAGATSFLLALNDPPVLIPYVRNRTTVHFLGSAAGSHLIIQEVEVFSR